MLELANPQERVDRVHAGWLSLTTGTLQFAAAHYELVQLHVQVPTPRQQAQPLRRGDDAMKSCDEIGERRPFEGNITRQDGRQGERLSECRPGVVVCSRLAVTAAYGAQVRREPGEDAGGAQLVRGGRPLSHEYRQLMHCAAPVIASAQLMQGAEHCEGRRRRRLHRRGLEQTRRCTACQPPHCPLGSAACKLVRWIRSRGIARRQQRRRKASDCRWVEKLITTAGGVQRC
mmetsp:Transcript_17719/g.35733  ORF Transcript_17719/g.35733 Transcript_17719/m.35733 type:complete len:231 (+) Transcript_17719:3886-4578(+)